MSAIIRFQYLVFVPALIIALGCASTSSETKPTDSMSTPISKTNDSGANISEKSAVFEPVYFDTGLAALRPKTIDTLKRYAKSILAHPEWGALRIEGHCDERGSDEYNLALGKRRATAVKRHLVDQGVPESRLATRTLGAQKPAVRGHDEKAWRFNRRSELRAEEVLASTSR